MAEYLTDPDVMQFVDYLVSVYPKADLERAARLGQFQQYQHDPIAYSREVLKVQWWEKQQEIARLLLEPPFKVLLLSAHSCGKTFTAAGLANWWYDTRDPGVVITTAPCYDDKTEVLTDTGWKFFRDLDRTEKVASLVDGRLTFVMPQDWMEFPSPGQMLGYQSRDLDFLVTPNHRLYVRRMRGQTGPASEWSFRSAAECYGQWDLRFSREINWEGVEDNWTIGQYELFGFWLADGYARYGGKSRRCDVILTQAFFPEYAKNLLGELGEPVREVRRTNISGRRPSWNFTIYSKKWAEFFVTNFYRNGHKHIPDWILAASTEKLKAFIRGFYKGDGDKSKRSRDQEHWHQPMVIRTYGGKEFADRLQIAALKAGFVTNLKGPWRGRGCITDQWTLGLLSITVNNKKYPNTKKHQWYTTDYAGRVYCVKVPSGIILVRRNGLYHWSGNTHREVVDLLWTEIRLQRRAAGLGDFTGTRAPELRTSDNHFAKGFTAKRGESFQGRHHERMLFLMDEAIGIDPIFWETTRTMFQPTGEHGWVCCFNPTDTASQAYQEYLRAGEGYPKNGWHIVTMGARDHPNIAAELAGRPPLYPGAVRLSQLNDWVQHWTTRISHEDIIPGFDFEWPPESMEWHRPGPLFESRAAGMWPSQATYSVWSNWLWNICEKSQGTIRGATVPEIGCDPARFGDDYTSIFIHDGGVAIHHETHNGWSLDQTAGRLKQLCREMVDHCLRKNLDFQSLKPQNIQVKIDCDGLGAGIIDMREDYNFIGLSGSMVNDGDFRNLRTELWFSAVEMAKESMVHLGRLPRESLALLRQQAVSPIYRINQRGQLEIEPKERTKDRLGRSPDDLDAMNLALYPAATWETPPVLAEPPRARLEPGRDSKAREKGLFR